MDPDLILSIGFLSSRAAKRFVTKVFGPFPSPGAPLPHLPIAPLPLPGVEDPPPHLFSAKGSILAVDIKNTKKEEKKEK